MGTFMRIRMQKLMIGEIGMSRVFNKRKIGSAFLIVIFVFAGALDLLTLNTNSNIATAGSAWTETSDNDFNDGNFKNVTLEGSGSNAKLKIDSVGLTYWTNLTPQGGIQPTARSRHGLAAISGTDKIVLFNSNSMRRDTWVYNIETNTWKNMNPTYVPPLGTVNQLATIYGTDKVMLFGGYAGGELNQTWVYDLSDNNWTNINPSNSPVGRYNHALASIYGDDKVVLFGGYHSTLMALDDTWVYDLSNNTWSNKNPSTKPSARHTHAMATVYNTDKLVLFGGSSGWDETWVYDLSENKWIQKTPNPKPAMRYSHAMTSITGTNKILLFGGEYGSSDFDDTWIYDLNYGTQGNWTEKILSPKPGSRYEHAMASHYYSDRTLLFGGRKRFGSYYGETCIFKYSLCTTNGTYISSPHKTKGNPDYFTLKWDAYVPKGASIKFQLRSSETIADLAIQSFVGPDGSTITYYTLSESEIWSGHDGKPCIQYKAYLNISGFSGSPTLQSVSITYNCLPILEVVGPNNGSVLSTNTPIFNWYFNDTDSPQQKAFQLLISDDFEFKNIYYDSGIQNNGEQSWAFPMGTSYTIIPDGTWYWKVRAKDSDEYWTDYSVPNKFQIDTVAPSSVPVIPINDGFYYELNTISGLAEDPNSGSGLNRIEISIRNLGNNLYWNGTSWSQLHTWISAVGTTTWTYDTTLIPWMSGIMYSVQSKAIDNANNVEILDDKVMFTIDQDSPVSNIGEPKDQLWLNNLDTISGSSMDFSGCGIDYVQISIKCIDDNRYWDGTTWNYDKSWITASGNTQWTFDSSTIPFSTGGQYEILCRGIDKVGNQELPLDSVIFWYDDQPPKDLEIWINNDEEFTTSTDIIVSLYGEDDGSGISKMAFSNDGSEWSAWEPFYPNLTLTLPEGDGIKTVYFKLIDHTGNIAEPINDTIVLDTTPPENLLISINNNAKFSITKEIKLDLQATDSLSGVGEMSLSVDGINWLPWEPYVDSKILNYYSSDGEKTVYFMVKDKVGNLAQPVFDSIIIDTTSPKLYSFIINKGESETNSSEVTLKINARDELSGLYQMSFSTDCETWSAWEEFTKFKPYSLSEGDGKKTIYVKVKDHVGNIGEIKSATIFLNTTTPKQESPTSTIFPTLNSPDEGLGRVIIIIILVIITVLIAGIVVVIKKKKKDKHKLHFAQPITIKPRQASSSIIQYGSVPSVPSMQISALAQPQPQVAKSSQMPRIASSDEPKKLQLDTPIPPAPKPITPVPPLPQLPPPSVQLDPPKTAPKVASLAQPTNGPPVHLPDSSSPVAAPTTAPTSPPTIKLEILQYSKIC